MAKKQNKKPIKKPVVINETPIQVPVTKLPEITVAASAPLQKLDRWFRKNIILVFSFLVLSWIGVRIIYYNTIVKSPLFSMYLATEMDNKFFDDWAKYLNTDWLNAKPFHPYHLKWHKPFADYYFEKHPDKLKEIEVENVSKDSSFVPGKALWNEWYHGNQYHQEPLYPYLLAVFYHFHIDEVKAMIILQLILGVLSGVFLFLITRKYFGETTAVLAGILYLFCGILMYNDIILLRTTWSVFLTILLVYVVDKAFSNQKPLNIFICGLCIGFSFLLLSTFSLYLVGVLILMFLTKRNILDYLKNSCLLVLGFLLMFAPVIIRNKIVGAPTFSISSTGPVTFIASNVYGTNSISGWSPSAERKLK